MSHVLVQEGIDLQVIRLPPLAAAEATKTVVGTSLEGYGAGRVLGGGGCGGIGQEDETGTGGHAEELLDTSRAATTTTANRLRVTLIIVQLSLVSFLASFSHANLVVGLPMIAAALRLSRELYLWPVSVYGLTSGSVLLVAGSIADLVGPRRVELAGIVLCAAFTLSCGLAATGLQLVVLRALQGIAIAMHMPASVAIVANMLPHGRARNIGFACLGLSQPLGYSFGLVLSGLMVERLGWRAGFYLAGGALFVAGVGAYWLLPRVGSEQRAGHRGAVAVLRQMATEVDWVGCALVSAGLAMLSYVLAYVCHLQSPGLQPNPTQSNPE
jgi:MFS family permease